jgi:hypothetical protein
VNAESYLQPSVALAMKLKHLNQLFLSASLGQEDSESFIEKALNPEPLNYIPSPLLNLLLRQGIVKFGGVCFILFGGDWFFFFWYWDWTQVLRPAKQALYHLSHTPVLLLLIIFQIGSNWSTDAYSPGKVLGGSIDKTPRFRPCAR